MPSAGPVLDGDGNPTGGSWKYLYERLGEKRFQQLCNALLAHEFPNVTCFPVGQSDGGRDAVRREGARSLIYQIKWTSRRLQDPVVWLDKAIREETKNIKRLVSEGADSYILMTFIGGTSAAKRGSMDRLDESLARHSRVFGIPMTCWWQADIDARVDKAPRELKWAYSDMLAGQDLVRYLIEADALEAQDRELNTVLLKVIATQWREDAKVRFKQVELDSYDLTKLFVDVEATRIPTRRASPSTISEPSEPTRLGGAASYLVHAHAPLTLVRGEPGQGKSTLGQYLCQVHRAEYLRKDHYLGAQRPELVAPNPRLPLRVDLRDYAMWMTGGDPLNETPDQRTRRIPRPASLEAFLAYLLEDRSGGMKTTITQVQDILNRFPTLLVLDGLDEVAQGVIRNRIVKEIDEFAARLGTSANAPQLVVTTRPNASGLAEPSHDHFETISLTRLSPALRTSYLRKWADTQSIRGRERRALERAFKARSSEPHIVQLAEHPMQLTILLYLMQKRGDSVPAGRTELYTSYMETLLDREAAKSSAVHNHRPDLEEVTAFLGWHMQSLAEATGTNGQLATKAIRGAINHYLFAVEKDTSLVDDLFTAVTDRVWALTSKVQGTFEFDVQPVREYFAARFLWEFAGAETRGFEKSTVLRHLIRRPYWLNTCRFFAGFANPNEVTGLVEGLEEELEEGARPNHVRVATWNLLADGVFASRTRTQRRASALLADDLSVRLMNYALVSDSGVVPLAVDRGGAPLVAELRARVVAEPTSPFNEQRMRLASRLLPDRRLFDAWWQPHMHDAIGTTSELAWLRAGIPFQAGARMDPSHVLLMQLSDFEAPEVALDAGVAPPANTDLEQQLLRAVLDGRCSESQTISPSFPGDVIRLLAPRHFLRMSSRDEAFRADVGHAGRSDSRHQRQSVIRRLKLRDSRFEQIQIALRFNKGQSRTTSPWGNTARELSDIFGTCWLAAEIAIIGAATPDRQWTTGGSVTGGSEPFGPAADYGRLLQVVRLNRSRVEWWQEQFDAHSDALSRATWALALASVASERVVVKCLDRLDAIVVSLDSNMRRALCLSSSRLGASRISRRLRFEALGQIASLSSTTGLLVAHHTATMDPKSDLPPLVDDTLSSLAEYGVAAWPASNALTARMLASPNSAVLSGLRTVGPRPTVNVGARVEHVPDFLLRVVLDDPASYPLEWVLAAERQVSMNLSDPHLSDVAGEGGWFSD